MGILFFFFLHFFGLYVRVEKARSMQCQLQLSFFGRNRNYNRLGKYILGYIWGGCLASGCISTTSTSTISMDVLRLGVNGGINPLNSSRGWCRQNVFIAWGSGWWFRSVSRIISAIICRSGCLLTTNWDLQLLRNLQTNHIQVDLYDNYNKGIKQIKKKEN